MARNQIVISGELIALESLRHTPAGVPMLQMTLRHQSTQNEAGMERQVQCEIDVVAIAGSAEKALAFSLGQRVKVKGFLAQRSLRSRQLVLHINDIILE